MKKENVTLIAAIAALVAVLAGIFWLLAEADAKPKVAPVAVPTAESAVMKTVIPIDDPALQASARALVNALQIGQKLGEWAQAQNTYTVVDDQCYDPNDVGQMLVQHATLWQAACLMAVQMQDADQCSPKGWPLKVGR